MALFGNDLQKCYLWSALAACVAGPAAAAPTAEALRAALNESSPVLRAAYEARDAAPLWLAGEAGAARALIATLSGAGVHALPAARYGAEALEARLETGADDPALELALSEAYLAYARDVSSGLLDPSAAGPDTHRRAPRPRNADLMEAAAAAPDMAAHLASLAPQDSDYAAVKEIYAQLDALSRLEGWGAPVAPGPTLRPGDRGPRVAALRTRLAAMGDYAPPAPEPEGAPSSEAAAEAAEPTEPRPAAPSEALFDEGLATALRGFQKRHGLNQDAALGPATLKALNASPAERMDQAAVNLERMRWMNRPLGEDHVIVNIPAFTVTLTHGGIELFHERVVVGKTKHQTPEFSDQMEYMVLNPAWNVPRSITIKELLPKLRGDPGYLARNEMRLIPTDGGPEPDPATHDFTYYDESYFPFRIQQVPTGDNALGAVKFMFPNAHAIYLHDTPSKRLFARDNRAYSHGCVRVQDPLRLAELLLGLKMDDAPGFVRRVIASGKERHVTLAEPVPVHIIYRTIWREADGAPQFRADIYGRDRLVAAALRRAGALPGDA